MAEALLLKRRSIFCVEWPGGGMCGVRKGIVDSVLSGCIPVFVENSPEPCELGVLFPLFISLRKIGVYILPSDFLSNKTNLTAMLTSISQEQVRRKQEEIARSASQLLYPLVDQGSTSMYIRDSAPETLLRALLAANIEPEEYIQY